VLRAQERERALAPPGGAFLFGAISKRLLRSVFWGGTDCPGCTAARAFLLSPRSSGVGREPPSATRAAAACQQDGLVNVAMPIEGRDGRERLRSLPVTISSDAGDRKNLDLVVFEGFVAAALDYEDGQNDKLTSFLKVLTESRQTFRIAYGERVFEFDVSRLPSAQARFTALCGHSQTAMRIAP
jgi:hypothetical protein